MGRLPMLVLRIESGTGAAARRELVPSGLIAVVAHAAIVAAAVLATLEPARAVSAEHSPVIIAWPEPLGRDRRGDVAVDIPGPPEIVVDAPRVLPVGLPPIDAGGRIEPFVVMRGVAGTGPAGDAGEAPADWMSVEEPPVLLAGPPPGYPDLLRAAGLQGRVVLQAAIDTVGRAEGDEVVVESSNRGLDAADLAYVRRAFFVSGRVHRRAVQ